MKNMNRAVIIPAMALIALVVLLSGCVQLPLNDYNLSAGGDLNKLLGGQTGQDLLGGGAIKGKCGDGVCGPVERENATCPEDCDEGTSGAIQGKCGDGICGPVEEEKGICPEDCE